MTEAFSWSSGCLWEMEHQKTHDIRKKNNKKIPKIRFLPFSVLFCDAAPAFSAYGESLVLIVDVDFNVCILTFFFPRIFTVFNCVS